jgi:hypothetical protein
MRLGDKEQPTEEVRSNTTAPNVSHATDRSAKPNPTKSEEAMALNKTARRENGIRDWGWMPGGWSANRPS